MKNPGNPTGRRTSDFALRSNHYYEAMAPDERELVDAMIAACRWFGAEPQNTRRAVMAEAVDVVMAGLSCSLPCCLKLSREERLSSLWIFNGRSEKDE